MKKFFATTRLLLSQQKLQDKFDERFVCLEEHEIKHLAQLQQVLKSKADVLSFAKTTGLPVDDLTLLRREVKSYQPKPVNLKDFPGVNPGFDCPRMSRIDTNTKTSRAKKRSVRTLLLPASEKEGKPYG